MLAPTAPIRIGAFKAWLSVWIGIAMVVGLGFGVAAPKAFETLGSFAIAQVNPVTATLVWLMILPTMVQIDYSNLPAIWRSRHSRLGSLVTLSANWITEVLDRMLNDGRSYLAGEYSIADIMHYPWLKAALDMRFPAMMEKPLITEWLKRIGERPAVELGMTAFA